MNSFKEYYVENTLSPYLMALGSVMPGAAGVAGAPSAETHQAVRNQTLDIDQFVTDWSIDYQTSNDDAKKKQAIIDLRRWDGSTGLTPEIRSMIRQAAEIFEGDHGATVEELEQYLIYTGYVESKYRDKIQRTNTGIGPARSYWQVEPSTAHSLVNRSFQYFGPNFRKVFPDVKMKNGKTVTSLQALQSLDLDGWTRILERVDKLAVTMAAAKWIATKYRKQVKK